MPPLNFPAMPAGLSVEVGLIAKVPSGTVLPSTAVYFHGTYVNRKSMVPPNTISELATLKNKYLRLLLSESTGWRRINRTTQPFNHVYEDLNKMTPLHSVR